MPPEPAAPHWSARWPGGLLLIALCLIAYLPGLRHLPPVDRDESRFAQASRQMLRSDGLSGWVVPMVGEKPRLNKPPLIYWLQACSGAALMPTGEPTSPANARHRRATGDVWVFRLPSVACAVAAALLTWGIGRSMFPRDRHTAWLAGAMLGVSLMVLWDARQARADQLLLALTTAAMWALWSVWSRGRDREQPRAAVLRGAVLFWLLIGLGVMAKGPVAPLVALLTLVSLGAATRRWGWIRALRPILGLGMAIAVIAPWVILVASEVGWGRYLSTILDETLGRSVAPAEGHWGPPGYHLLLLPVMFWPGSLLTAAAIVHAWRRCRAAPTGERGVRAWCRRFTDQCPQELFLLAWLIPSWIMFELIGTKLPHYTLPLYPALALLSARAVNLAASSPEGAATLGLRSRGGRAGLVIWTIIGMVLAAGIAPALARSFGLVAPRPLTLMMGAGAGIGAGLMLSALRAALKDRWLLAQTMAIIAAAIASAGTFGIVLPRLSGTWVSSRLVHSLATIDPRGGRPIAAIGYHEDSLVFLTDARVDRIGLAALPEWLGGHPGGIVIVPTTRVEDCELLLGGTLNVLGRVTGFNYSKGRWEDLVLTEGSDMLGLEPSQGGKPGGSMAHGNFLMRLKAHGSRERSADSKR